MAETNPAISFIALYLLSKCYYTSVERINLQETLNSTYFHRFGIHGRSEIPGNF
jgi:hypothetical protein